MGELSIQHAPLIQLKMRPSSPRHSIRCQVGFTIPGHACATGLMSSCLTSFPGQFQLVDVSLRLPGLKRRPGMSKWQVAVDKDATVFFDSQRDFLASLPMEREKNERGKVPQTLFPPENVRDLHLERR